MRRKKEKEVVKREPSKYYVKEIVKPDYVKMEAVREKYDSPKVKKLKKGISKSLKRIGEALKKTTISKQVTKGKKATMYMGGHRQAPYIPIFFKQEMEDVGHDMFFK